MWHAKVSCLVAQRLDEERWRVALSKRPHVIAPGERCAFTITSVERATSIGFSVATS